MKNYQIVLPLLALAFAMTFVEKTAALSLWLPTLPVLCPLNQVPGCYPCHMPYCSDIANPWGPKCLGCSSGCICKFGFYWQDDDCVPAKECRVTCPENMVFEDCSAEPIDPNVLCLPRCVCKPGYVLSQQLLDRKCIPMTE
ncbi:uncharacterized protein ACMZJ9_018747 [Mantella aurantiaca]